MGSAGSRAQRSRTKVRVALTGLLLGALLPLAACGDANPFRPAGDARPGGPALGNFCPRPPGLSGVQPGFNDQERELRHLRRLAFAGDFFAQIELGRRYEAQRALDANIQDPIESAVWYAVALANPEGYAPINMARRSWGVLRPVSRYDDCRAWERHVLYRTLDRLLSRMSSVEQGKVRDRVIYVMSTQGADGYRTLARIYDTLYGPFGEPVDNDQALEATGGRRPGGVAAAVPIRPAAVGLFTRNDVDAYLYNYLAMQTGDVGAYVLLKDFERSEPRRASYGAFVEAKAKRWVPPYEFYPPEAPDAGVPHSDEARITGDGYELALSRLKGRLPFVHVGRALRYLGVVNREVTQPQQLLDQEVETLEGMLGRNMTGDLESIEWVRAIQYAAVQGSADSQLVLAVMYTEGVGVPTDYARAFYWFSEADRQGSAEAKFAMSSYFALGVAGVADQEKAKAVVYRMDSALSGFAPSSQRVQAVLAQVSRSRREQNR